MAPRTTLSAQNLEALGAVRLAELLMEIGAGDAAVKRRLRVALAAAAGPREAASEVGKRLATIARGRSFVDRSKCRVLADDLAEQRKAIVTQVAVGEPGLALDLLWQLLALAEPVHARSDDSDGVLGSEFRATARDVAAVAATARPDPRALAERTYAAITARDYGQADDLVALLAPALGAEGLAHLAERVEALARTPVQVPPAEQRVVVGWSSHSGKVYADEYEARARESTVRRALAAIADARGDVDGWVAQQDPRARTMPAVAAAIARRLLDAERAEEALAALDAVPGGRLGLAPATWWETRIEALEVLGSAAEAQAVR